MSFERDIIFAFIGDCAIWFGLYILHAKAHIRKCQNLGENPQLGALRVRYITGFLLFHLFFLWMGYEVVKWGGPD